MLCSLPIILFYLIFIIQLIAGAMKLFTTSANLYRFSTITHLRGKSQNVASRDVKLRGIHIKSTANDSPNLIFFPEAFDQAQSWLNFFSNPLNKILAERNVYILYPRNFGNSDHCDVIGWEDHANDVVRFMYDHKISMATLAGHGIGAKIALAAACYHYDKVTGYFSIDSTPMNQYYHEGYRELRQTLKYLEGLNIKRRFGSINLDLKNKVLCPRWRTIFQNNLVKSADGGYNWNFNLSALVNNLSKDSASNLTSWASNIGLYPGRVGFVFPEYSRYVHLSTNTNPIYKVCPKAQGLNHDIFYVQGDENPLNHWVYELPQDNTNPYAYRLSKFLRHYDGVHVLLKNRDEVGNTYVPDINNARNPREDFAGDRIPAHYYHNWRFNNVYQK